MDIFYSKALYYKVKKCLPHYNYKLTVFSSQGILTILRHIVIRSIGSNETESKKLKEVYLLAWTIENILFHTIIHKRNTVNVCLCWSRPVHTNWKRVIILCHWRFVLLPSMARNSLAPFELSAFVFYSIASFFIFRSHQSHEVSRFINLLFLILWFINVLCLVHHWFVAMLKFYWNNSVRLQIHELVEKCYE